MTVNSLNNYDVLLDGIFGFSFKGDSIRSPFDKLMDSMRNCDVPIVSIDVPYGMDKVDIHNIGLSPEWLISLTAPKMCAKRSKVSDILGGRFAPPESRGPLGSTIPISWNSQVVYFSFVFLIITPLLSPLSASSSLRL